MNLKCQGENVHLALVSTAAGSTSAAMSLFNANGEARTLRSTERLIIDDMIADISTGTVDILSAAAGATVATSSTLVCSLNTAVGLWVDSKEGVSLPVGVVPSVLPSSSTAVMKISGNGRIVEGTTQGVRPSWQAPLQGS